jgi:steroid delta-isomerase
MPTADEIRTTVANYVEYFTAGDTANWVNLFAEDARVEDPVGSPLNEGHEAIGAFFEMSQSLGDSITLVPTGPVRVAGNEAAWPMQAVTSVGDAKLVVDIIDVMVFDEQARITSLRAFWDPAEIRSAEG